MTGRPSIATRARSAWRQLRNDGIYTPPSLQGTLVHPATGGGANWSGGAFDPVRRLLFVPVNN